MNKMDYELIAKILSATIISGCVCLNISRISGSW